MLYPVEQLRLRTGYISAQVFENKFSGLAETFYWSVAIEFEPIVFDGDSRDPFLQVDAFTLPIRDWRDLEGQVVEGGDDVIQAGFYVYGHDYASWSRLQFGKRTGFSFEVDLEIKVELLGLDPNWEGSGPSVQPATIRIQATLPFTDFYIDEGMLEVSPETTDSASTIAARHADLSCYKPAKIEGRRFVFEPVDA